MGIETPVISSMDRPRASARRPVWPVVAITVVLGMAALVLVRTGSPVPIVDRTTLVTDTVTSGLFVHEVSAAGSLIAEQPRVIAAPAAGRIEMIRIEHGDQLETGEVILKIANREIMRQLLEVEQQLAAGEADLEDLRATLQARSLESEAALRRTEFQKQDADRQAEASSKLAEEGLISSLEALRQREAAEELAERVVTERDRHAAIARSAQAQLQAQNNRLERHRDFYRFHSSLVETLLVRAPAETTAREILVQEGEWVSEGQRLVRLVEPDRLKAVLQVPEAAAHLLGVGQRVTMNARGTALQGRIDRVAAAVEQGTVAAEVRLEGELPTSARPDLSVEGRIEVSRIPEALSIARPLNAMPDVTGRLYEVGDDSRTAVLTEVRFGTASVDRIVLISGARTGDHFVIAGLDGRTEPVIRLK